MIMNRERTMARDFGQFTQFDGCGHLYKEVKIIKSRQEKRRLEVEREMQYWADKEQSENTRLGVVGTIVCLAIILLL